MQYHMYFEGHAQIKSSLQQLKDIVKSVYYSSDQLHQLQRRIHTSSAIPGQWMCFVGSCKEAPRSFLNHHQHEKHQQDHANVKCPECGKSFAAKRNMNRHMKSKHKAVEASNISSNSNESISDDNYNPDIIINAVFI